MMDKIIPLNFEEILVVIGHEKSRMRKALQDYQVQFVYNPDYKQGMATSIVAGVSEAGSTTDGYIIFLGDMPWIDPVVLEIQIKTFYDNPKSAIVVPVFQQRRGNPVIFAKTYRKDLLRLSGDNGARVIVEKFEDQVIEISIDREQQLKDVDGWEDYNDSNMSTIRDF